MNISFLSLMMMIWIGIHKFNSIQFNCHYRISFSEFCCWNRFLFLLLLLWILLSVGCLVDSIHCLLKKKNTQKEKNCGISFSRWNVFDIFFLFFICRQNKNEKPRNETKKRKRNFPGIEIENSNDEKIKKIRIRCLFIHYRIWSL